MRQPKEVRCPQNAACKMQAAFWGQSFLYQFSSLKNTQEKAAQKAFLLSVLPFAFANANSVVIE